MYCWCDIQLISLVLSQVLLLTKVGLDLLLIGHLSKSPRVSRDACCTQRKLLIDADLLNTTLKTTSYGHPNPCYIKEKKHFM